MIKQIAAKKIDLLLTKHLKRFSFDQLSDFLPQISARSPVSIPMKRPLLAPLQNKPVISLQESPKAIPDVLLPEAEEGSLLMGDVITLIAVESQDMPVSSGVITGDGIAHNLLDCIPTSTFVNSEKIQFRLCLFRIEPVRQYGYNNILRTYGKLKMQNETQLESCKKAAEEEHFDNENEAELSYGKVLSFGERIQLRHIHSNSFITTSREVSKERGCLQVILDPIGNESSWLELTSCSLIRQDGESIKYSDNFCLTLTVDNSKYYLHMGAPKSWKEDVDYELNASSNSTHWQARKFISHSSIIQNPEFVTTGDSFRIIYRLGNGYLSITQRNIDEILPLDSDVDPVKSLRVREKKESSSKIIIEKEKTCLSVWELVRENPFLGGIAEKNSLFRIKHVATGLLLCANTSGNLYLTYERNLELSLFRIIQEPSEQIYQTFNTIVKIESNKLKKVLMAGTVESMESIFFSSEDAAQVSVSLTLNRKQNTKTSFVLVDEDENNAIYVYQISSLLPQIVVFFSYVKLWGCLKRGNAFVQSFELAKNTEPELESKVNFLLKILHKIKKRVLVEGVMFKERQDILRLTGLLDLLVRFAILLDKKLELPPKFPIDGLPKHLRKSKLKMILEGPKYLKEEFLTFPGVVGAKHIMKLSRDIYETIYHSIKNNIESCKELEKYQEFFSSQLFSYKDQVGILIKEFYKMSSGTIVKSNPNLFKVWIEQIKPISEKDDNVDEQIVTLKILASLCVDEKQGIPLNQNILAANFFSSERDYIILKCFLSESEAFVGFAVDKATSFTDFLLNNPILSGLSFEEKQNNLLIYLISLTENRNVINYLASFFEFITKLCQSKNEKVSKKVIETIGLSFDHLFSVVSNPKIHCKLRKPYLKLLWTLYFDKETQITLDNHQERCFLWNPETNTQEDEQALAVSKQSIFDKMQYKPIPLTKATDWLNSLWMSTDLPFSEFSTETLADQIRFVIELINFSKNLINHGYISYGFIMNVTPYILSLIEDKPRISMNNWTFRLKIKMLNLRNESLHIEFIKEILDFFYVKFFSKIDTEVKNKIAEYSGRDIMQISSRGKKSSFSPRLFKISKKKKKKVRDMPENEKLQTASLDTVLLNLLFNHADHSLKEKIIELLLCSFDLNSRLLSSLNDIVLVPPGEIRDSYLLLKKTMDECETAINNVKFLDATSLIDGITQENPEIDTIREGLRSRLKIIKACITKKKPLDTLRVLQKICKNLAFHKLILKLFTDDWPWVEKSETRVKLQENTKELYRIVIKVLINFSYNNTENQLLLYEYLQTIESFKGNFLGTKLLLAEVLKCRRNNLSSIRIIQQIFLSMGKKASPLERPHDLHILKNLIFDENLKFVYSNQTTIIKSLLATKNLQAIFSCETSWDLYKFSSNGIKFFSTMLGIISWCAIYNDYATHQARRMIPLKVLMKEISGTSMMLVKKAYLHFLFYVFFMKSDNIERELTENILDDILENIIHPDIVKFKSYLEFFTVVAMKGMYSPVLVNAVEKANSVSLADGKKAKQAKMDNLTREQAETLEYWKYIHSRKPESLRISTGLLCVIKDITQECKSSDLMHGRTLDLLRAIKQELQLMLDQLFQKSLQCEEINMDPMIKEITTTMLEIPYFENPEEINLYNNFLALIKQYLEDNHISFQEFVDSNLTFDGDFILREDFMKLIKIRLMLKLKVEEIEGIMRYLEPAGNPEISIGKVLADLKSELIGNPYVVRKERVEEPEVEVLKYEDTEKKFLDFLGTIERNYDEGENDISLMVNNLKTELLDPAFAKGDSTVLLKLIKNLSQAFYKLEHKIYFINILKYILLHEISGITEESPPDKLKTVTSIQNIYSNENVIEICFAELNKETIIENTISALDLLSNLVKFNNSYAKQKILDYLKINGFAVFSFIKSNLRETQDILTSSASRLPNDRKRSLNASSLSTKASKKNSKMINLTKRILLFLQVCCDNCFLPFQEFLQVQNPLNPIVNIDLVNEMSQFLINLEDQSDLKNLSMNKSDLAEIAIQCIRTLTDCCQGPCLSNQIVLGQCRRLYEFMNWVFKNKAPDFTIETVWLEVYTEGVKFLNALIEANTNLKVAKIFIREIDLEMLKNHAAGIWKQLVEGRERALYQDNQGTGYGISFLEISGKHFERFEKNVIDTGFGIYILLLTLQYMHPSECNLKLNSLKEIDSSLKQAETLRPGFREIMKNSCKRMCNPKVQEDSQQLDMVKAQDFYYSNIASVEINNRDNLAKLFFRMPSICRYITVKSRSELILKVNRASHQEKIEDFMHKSYIYEIEMRHQQEIARYPLLDAFVSRWRLYGKMSYVTVICINLILLTTVKHVDGEEGPWKFVSGINNEALLTVVAVIQIILAGFVYICYMIEYLPVIKFKSGLKSKGSKTIKYLSSAFNRIKGTELMKEVLIRTESEAHKNVSNFVATMQIVFLDFECVYNLIYLTISVLSWKWSLLYSVLLLDLIKRNNDLKNILRSITLNGKQLLLTTFLGLIVLYIFSIIAFLNFSQFYSDNFDDADAVTYCDTLVNCFISTSITGIRQGGGIGDVLLQTENNVKDYWGLMVFDMMYFAIVINILLNIIFGIIIDTFGELREQSQAELRDIKENCFICGNQRFLFEVRRISWGYHLNMEHNPTAYLAFLIYIRHKPTDECSGAEKYVKEKLEKNETSFFPLTSLSLISGEADDNNEELDEVQQKVNKILRLTNKVIAKNIKID